MPDAPFTLTVLILNWNSRAYLEACLAALEAQTLQPERVVLIDNGSTDDSLAFVRDRFPQVELRENGGNLGFAAGNNTALAGLESNAAVLLNPDVVLSPDCLAALAAALAGDPRIGIAGAKLWYPDRKTIQHAGGTVRHPQAMPGHYGFGERDSGQHDAARDVDYVIGGAAAVRREVLETVGLLDEGFFLYFEDADYCARARDAGYRVVYEPRATAVHVESAVAVKGSFSYFQRFHTGRWRYLLKHFPAAEILNETLPAEAAWLEQIADDERRAASLAYLATSHALPGIWLARGAKAPLSADERAAVAAGLMALRDQALRHTVGDGGLAALAAAAVVVERPFTSNVPLLGPLIARFRAAWNNVASRWYVHHVVVQQNEFNRLAVRQLETYEIELREQMALLEEQVVAQEELQQRVQELSAHLAELRRAISAGGPRSDSA